MDRNIEQAVKLIRRDLPVIASLIDQMKAAGLAYNVAVANVKTAVTDEVRQAACLLICAATYFPPAPPA